MYSYGSVLEAINDLRQRGYSEDFSLAGEFLTCLDNKINPNEFEITEVYRFEGDSNPDDEAIVYGIESTEGIKGILINGYGISAEAMSEDLIKKLRMHAH